MKKILSIIITGTLAVAIGVTAFATNLFNFANKDTDNGGEEIKNEVTADGVAASESNGISVMYLGETQSQSSATYKLTATITPSNATYKEVDWSIAFVNANSTWASGKNVEDYVTVTPDSDGALTATLTCKKAFGEQISVTATNRNNNTHKATCSIDYRRKITRVDILGQDRPSSLTLDYNDCKDIYSSPIFEPELTLSDYTINDSFKKTLSIKFSKAFLDKISEAIPDVSFRVSSFDDAGRITYLPCDWTNYVSLNNSGVGLGFDAFATLPVGGSFGVADYPNYSDTVRKILINNPDLGYFATFKVVCSSEYSTVEFEVPVKYDISTLPIPVDSITFDKTQIIF